MQSKHRLLVFGLGRHGPHPRLVRCRPDRPCIGRIGLVCLYEWANELRMQEHHLVTKRLDLARPPMPAPARFQRHPTRGSLSQKAYQLITRKPTIHDLTALHIDPVQLECTLCNVQAICRSIHFGPSVPQVAVSKLHFGTLMPFGPGGPSCFLLGPSSPKGGRCPCHLGQMQTSSARNVAMTPSQCPTTEAPGPYFQKGFFHNGYIKSLKQLVHFYNTRYVYPFNVTSGHCPAGKTEKVDCWPTPEVPNNLDMTIGSLGLTDHEEDLIVIFLRTLTDGFTRPYANGDTFTGACMTGGSAKTQGN